MKLLLLNTAIFVKHRDADLQYKLSAVHDTSWFVCSLNCDVLSVPLSVLRGAHQTARLSTALCCVCPVWCLFISSHGF